MKSTSTKKATKAVTITATVKPFPFQEAPIREHVAYFKSPKKDATGRLINARLEGSDMGVGKTFIAAFTAKRLNRPVGVICPKASVPIWADALKKVGVQVIFVHNYEALVRSTKPWVKSPERIRVDQEYAAMLTEYNERCLQVGPLQALMLRKPQRPETKNNDFVWDVPKDILLIWDEAHRCKAEDSLSAEMLMGAVKQEIASLLCSATAATSPAEMRAMGFAIGLHSLADFHTWALLHGCYFDNWGKLNYGANARGLDRLNSEIYPEHGSRVRIVDLPKGMFPETQIAAESYSMGNDTGKIQKVYDDMERELDAFANGGSTSKGMHPFTIILRARQKVELLKVPAFAEMAKDAIADGMRVLIFVNFTKTLLALAERLNTGNLFFGGNKSVRNKVLADFQANKKGSEALLLNVAAGAESISCHDLDGRFPRYSVISPSYSAFKMHQATGRPHRAGGKSASIQRIVYAAGTIEDKICRRVREKLNNMVAINDGEFMPDYLQEFLVDKSDLMKQVANITGAESEE